MFLTIAAFTLFLVVATVLPFLPASHGIVRVGDFPRQQIFWLALALLIASTVFGGDETAWRVMQMALAAIIVIQGRHIVRYTPLWRKQTVDAGPGDKGVSLKLASANVKMGNDRYEAMRTEIARVDPDIAVFMEVDDKWRDGLASLLDTYDHVVDEARDNSYGMIVASKLPLSNLTVEELLTDGVPSVIATVTVEDGRSFRLYCLHPEPPVPHKGTEGRDGETALAALKVKDETLPVIVTGDLNDVAWSLTTERFRKVSGLLDPRIGRRVFSTFDARLPFLRWPLDHLFHSPEFRLVGMERLAASGSDHFPVLFELLFCDEEKAHSRPDTPDSGDIKDAQEVVKDARARDEEAIGTDWEK
ncbi:endonuclease/exonuclease/phosphatase family protein [Aliihoeflea sp. PC F10.4]